jgi:ElaB/YqjD/DUF883 family membrane-anchored ribosome-binding protein
MAERTSLENKEINEPDYSLEVNETEETDEATDETDKIREQIEETRQDLSETINALQEKLSFENISEQVTEQVSNQISTVYQKTKETVYDNTLKTAGKFLNTVGKEMEKTKIYNIAKDNPLPLFLIALGAGLLLFKKSGSGNNSQSNYRLKGNNRGKHRRNEETRYLADARDKISSTASSAYQSTTEYAGNAYESVRDSANKGYEKVSDLGNQAREQYDYYISENPLAVGAVALAAGVGVGMLLPTTRYEENLMGETSRNLLNLAKDKTTETVQTLKSAAGHAADNLKESAGQAVEDFKQEVQTQNQPQNPS